MSTFSVRMDEQLKSDFDKLCELFGMNTSVAITIFVRANGIQWQQWIDEGMFKNVTELATHLGRDRARVSHTLQLALLSPEIIHLVIIGALPNHITLQIVNRSFPADWEEQKKFFGIK